tara:strand:+ start:3496 stop:5772 length:2277 start_codon:yes stop_codon:yes gene_type:complete
MSCSDKPIFVIIKETPAGYSFDNDVTYNSPFAKHVLSQPADMTHPSLVVTSSWGLNKSITQMATGNAGFSILQRANNKSNFIRTHNNRRKFVGLIDNGTRGYKLARTAPLSGNAPSVMELTNLLKSISNSGKNIKVRGSPLEYKRLLDYFQFLLVSKVQAGDLFLTRPNNVHIMDDINDPSKDVTLEEAYLSMFDQESSNRTMYNNAYFVTMDRVAALAAVVRQIPTIYQTVKPQNYYDVPTGNVNRITKFLQSKLKTARNAFEIPNRNTPMKNHPNRMQELITPKGKPIITKGPLFKWFLDTRNIQEKGNREVGANFHKFSADNKALILFYWVFAYPSGTHTTNLPFIEAFLSILDTFHDFTGSRATNTFKNIIGTENTRNNLKRIDHAQLSLNDFNTKKAHKTLVKLLGTDIYRKSKKAYNTPLKTIILDANKRGLNADDKVGRMLYFITSMLGSDSGSLVQACEKLSQEILLHLANNEPIYERPKTFVFGEGRNKLCDKLDREGACLVIDAISGSLPQCLAKHSVYHNVGVLDPATRSILSWSEVDGNEGCVDGAKEKLRQRQLRFKRRQEQKRLLKEKDAKERAEKAKATRAQRIREAAAKAAANAAANAVKTKTQTLGRAARAAAREAAQKRKRNNNASPNKNTKAQTPVVKRERNNNALPNKRPTKMTKLTSFKPPRGNMEINNNKKSPPPRQQGLNSIPESRQITGTTPSRRETRSARAARLRRNAPASFGTRSRARTPGSAQGRTSRTTR